MQMTQADQSGSGCLPRRHYTMLAYVCVSLSMAMLVQQTTGIERGSWQYLVYVGMAVALPLFSLPAIVKSLFGRCVLLSFWLLWTGTWFLWIGDGRAVGQLALLIFVMAWVATDQARLDDGDLAKLYVGLILLGAGILCFTTLNGYSLVPGRAIPDYGVWRVSFFPNIAYSGILSLALLMILTRDAGLVRAYPWLLVVATYFLVFSFVRAALLSALMYLALRLWFGRWQVPRPRQMFWTAICVAFGFVALTAVSVQLLYMTQGYWLVSATMLRGMSNMTVDQIAYQIYRPWLWGQQLHLFLSSPWLMGWGSADFYGLVAAKEGSQTMLVSAGSEALPTRLLVVYGASGLLFSIYLVQRLRKLALADDRWACACFPALFNLMMNWGSVFHPSDALFVIILLITTKGSEGFASQGADSAYEAERKAGFPPVAAPT